MRSLSAAPKIDHSRLTLAKIFLVRLITNSCYGRANVKLTAFQSYTLVMDEDGILNRVLFDRVTLVRRPEEEAEQATNAETSSLTQTAFTSGHIVRDGNKDKNDIEVNGTVLNLIWSHDPKAGGKVFRCAVLRVQPERGDTRTSCLHTAPSYSSILEIPA